MVEDTLKRLAREFTARDIMIPAADLVCGADANEARSILEQSEYADYDVIPIVREGRIAQYIARGGDNEAAHINLHADIIGDGTSILDLVNILAPPCPFVFVMVGNKIGGFIHFSDMNHRLVELTFYLLAQSVENHLVSLIRSHVTEQLLPSLLPDRSDDLLKHYRKQRRRAANLDLLNVLYLKDIVRIAQEVLKFESVPESVLEDLIHVRDSVAHAARLLVANHADVSRLVKVHDLSMRLLQARPR